MVNSGRVLNSWESTVDSSYKIISFVDCGGLEKYHRTNLQGYLSYAPDYAILVVAATRDPEELSWQIELAVALQSNFCIVVTHYDHASEKQIARITKSVL